MPKAGKNCFRQFIITAWKLMENSQETISTYRSMEKKA